MMDVSATINRTRQHAVCARHNIHAGTSCSTLRYVLGETPPIQALLSSVSNHSAAKAELAIIGHALTSSHGTCTTSVTLPWKFVFNGTDSAPLAGCPPGCENCCCEDIRTMHALCELAGVPRGTAFLMISGDSKPHSWWPHRLLPVFSGNRHVGGGGIVAPMQSLRFFEDVALRTLASPVPFARKVDKLYWRGDSTGFEPGQSRQRTRFIHSLRQRGHDVAFYKWPVSDVETPTRLRAGDERWATYYRVLRNASGHVTELYSDELNATAIDRADVDQFIPIEQQLGHKYMLCLEGNSMATAIMWMLAADSVVLMPPPTQEGWALEGRLQPWVHYVPVRSPERVDYALAWLRAKSPERGEAIIRNANRFVRQVLRETQPCPDFLPARNDWEWSKARDGEREQAYNMRKIIRCLMDAKMAKAVINHAAEGLTAFMRAGDSEVCVNARCEKASLIRRAALRAAREMRLPEAERAIYDKYAPSGAVEGLGR